MYTKKPAIAAPLFHLSTSGSALVCIKKSEFSSGGENRQHYKKYTSYEF